MPTWLLIVVIALGILIIVFGIGGAVVINRRIRGQAAGFDARLDDINRDLAAAHATDNGWEPAALQSIARAHFAEARPGVKVSDVTLVQVIDPPGTDDDRAVFRFDTPDGAVPLELGRREGAWVTRSVG